MPTLATRLLVITAMHNNVALGQAQKLHAMVELARGVDQAPTVLQIINFVQCLVDAPPGPALAPGMLGPAAWPPAWNPTPGQQAALNQLLGVPGAMGMWLPGPGTFVGNPAALQFANFDRASITLQLILRIIEPRCIAQGSHPLCGPTVMMQSFAQHSPAQYVAYVCGLAENRTGTITSGPAIAAAAAAAAAVGGAAPAPTAKVITLLADSNLLQANPPHYEIPQADYIALASLRDQGYWLFHTPYNSPYTNQTLEGATTADALVRWMRESGYTNVEDNTLTRARNVLTKAVAWSRNQRGSMGDWLMRDNINLALARIGAGRSVFMAVAGNLAQYALGATQHRDPKWMTMFGGHWVTLLAANVGAAGVQFHVRTWTRETDAAQLVNVPWTKVGNWYRGFVCGTP